MIEIDDAPELVDPIVIAAFEGWNDAADAASSVVDHLMRVWDARIVGAVDPEDFYDFQVNRPVVGTDALAAGRDYRARTRGFELVAKLGQMNELWENIAARPPPEEGEDEGRVN